MFPAHMASGSASLLKWSVPGPQSPSPMGPTRLVVAEMCNALMSWVRIPASSTVRGGWDVGERVSPPWQQALWGIARQGQGFGKQQPS